MNTARGTESRDWYVHAFEGFEKSLNGGAATLPLHEIRRQAIDSFAATSFPSRRNESWRHTNIAPVVRLPFHAVTSAASVGAEQLGAHTFDGLECVQLVFVDGHFAPSLSSMSAELPQGVVVASLATALEETPALVEPHLGRRAPYEGHGFAALNTAFIRDGAFVHVPSGTALSLPVHVLYVSTASGGEDPGTVTYPRTLVVVEDGSQAAVIESYVGLESGQATYLTNAVTEIVVGARSRFEHVVVVRESKGAYHIASLHVTEGADCEFTSHNISLSGQLVRNEITTVLNGENIESTLNGFFLASGDEHVDNHTTIEHASPDCVSHELYKGVLAGKAHGVFRGKIHVHQVAQRTDAYQSNQNLLLSDDAQITSKPQLEIYADDVKCSHGSTTGQLDEDAIFYLRTRGVGRKAAVGLLTRAFAGDVIDRIGIEPVRQRLTELVGAGLDAMLGD